MELDAAHASKVWSLRKAAWAIEDLEQDIGLIYRTMGIRGLESIPEVGQPLAIKIQRMILEGTAEVIDRYPRP